MRWQSRVELDHSDDEIIMSQQVELSSINFVSHRITWKSNKIYNDCIEKFYHPGWTSWMRRRETAHKSLPRRQLSTAECVMKVLMAY